MKYLTYQRANLINRICERETQMERFTATLAWRLSRNFIRDCLACPYSFHSILPIRLRSPWRFMDCNDNGCSDMFAGRKRWLVLNAFLGAAVCV